MRNFNCRHTCNLKDCSFCLITLCKPIDTLGMKEETLALLHRQLQRVGYCDEYWISLKHQSRAIDETAELPSFSMYQETGVRSLNWVTGQIMSMGV